MHWRVISLEVHDAFTNMALDEVAGESVAKNVSIPTIRFYTWNPSAVSIGCFQSIEDEIDLVACSQFNVDSVRRRTGGGAVYHDTRGEITYSVIAPQDCFPKNIIESYQVICGWIIDSMKLLGLDAQFIPINDIIINGKKFSGNAQTRRNGILLQHGTILYDVDVKKMFSLLKVPTEKIRDKMIAAVEERVTSIKKEDRTLTRDAVYEALVKGFTTGKEWEFGSWTAEELSRAKALAETRYKKKEWNFSR